MEIVAPLRVHAIAACFDGFDEARIVQVALGDDYVKPTCFGFESADFCTKLLHEVNGGSIHVGVHGVEAQAVDVIVAQPHEGVVAEEAPYFVTACVFEIDRVTPRRVVEVREIWTEFREVISGWAEVVIDHIEKHGEAMLVTGVYE